MKEINLPPFFVGQKVVSLVDGINGRIKKGDVLVVEDIIFCCGEWRVNIGQSLSKPYTAHICDKCRSVLSHSNTVPAAKHFAPVQENFQSISLEKILEQETSLISAS